MKHLMVSVVVGICLFAVGTSMSWPGTAAPGDPPIVGSWVEFGSPEGVKYYTFFADGNALYSDGRHRLWHGAWQADATRPNVYLYTVQTAEDDATTGGKGQTSELLIADDGVPGTTGSTRLQRIVVEGLPAAPAT